MTGPVPVLDLSPEIELLWDELNGAFQRVLRSGQFVMGPEVEAFEAEVAETLGVRHAVGVNSGTDALVIALRALGVGPGDEVITTPFSFFATAESIGIVGATPVFADVEEESFNIDPDAVEEKIGPKTRAIIPVHLYGRPADMPRRPGPRAPARPRRRRGLRPVVRGPLPRRGADGGGRARRRLLVLPVEEPRREWATAA